MDAAAVSRRPGAARERAAEARTGRSPAAQRRPQGVLDAAAREPIMPAAGKGRSHPLDLETKRCSIWSAVGPRQVMTQAVQIELIWCCWGAGSIGAACGGWTEAPAGPLQSLSQLGSPATPTASPTAS